MVIILHHKLLWMYDYSELESQIEATSNGASGTCFSCLNPNNFHTDYYPKLVELEQLGIEVMCIGCDIGNKVSRFEFLTSEGVQFLASGFSVDQNENSVLLLYHNIENRKLSFEFKSVNDLAF